MEQTDVRASCQTRKGAHARGSSSLPKMVAALAGVKVCQGFAGFTHSMVLTEGGEVMTFGRGDAGQLGHGDTQNQHVPTSVAALVGGRVCQVVAGSGHSMVLTEGGEVMTFGCGGVGQLGRHGDREDQLVPKRLRVELV